MYHQMESIMKKSCLGLFLSLCFFLPLYGGNSTHITRNKQTLTYYLYISDFAQSFIEIPTSNVSGGSSTISSKYLAGRAAIYNEDNAKAGTCSASFLCMQKLDSIF